MDFNGVQTVQGPNESFSTALNKMLNVMSPTKQAKSQWQQKK